MQKMGDSAKAVELEDRLIDFAVRIIKVADALPESPAGKHVSRHRTTPKLAVRKATPTLYTS
jgi:hypothetical protein